MKKGFNVILGLSLVSFVGAGIYGYIKILKSTEKEKRRFTSYYSILNRWLTLKIEGKSIIEYFEINNYKKIAVYGFGELGSRLLEDLEASDIEIAYFIDKEAENVGYGNITIVSPDEVDDQEPVDVIVVTPIHYFDEIEQKLRQSVNCDIVSIEDVMYL